MKAYRRYIGRTSAQYIAVDVTVYDLECENEFELRRIVWRKCPPERTEKLVLQTLFTQDCCLLAW